MKWDGAVEVKGKSISIGEREGEVKGKRKKKGNVKGNRKRIGNGQWDYQYIVLCIAKLYISTVHGVRKIMVQAENWWNLRHIWSRFCCITFLI